MTRGTAGTRLTVNNVAMFLSPVLSELPSLVGLYSNYPEVVEIILELLHETSKNMILYLSNVSRVAFLDLKFLESVYHEPHSSFQENTKVLNTASLQTMQTFANCNSNRLSLQSSSEDDTFKDIQLLLKLLSNLLSKDFCDFCKNFVVTFRQVPS